MSEIDVVALISAKPGSEELVQQALTELVTPTRSEEGCLAYYLSVSQADPTVFVTVERWRSQADLDAHLQTEHIAKAFAAAGDHLIAAPAIHPLTNVV